MIADSLRETIKQLSLGSLIAYSRMVRRISHHNGVVVCSAPVSECNRGDQALLVGTVDWLKKSGFNEIHLVETSCNNPITSFKNGDGITIHREFGLMFESPRSFAEHLQFIQFLANKRELLVIGADVLDETYTVGRSAGTLFATKLASLIGVPNRIIGFSVGDTPSQSFQQRLHSLSGTRLFARDRISYERLSSCNVPNLELAGDLAFLLDPGGFEELDDDLKKYVRKNTGQLIGLNFTDRMGAGTDRDALFQNIVEACRQIAESRNLRFLLIPHVDWASDIDYLKDLHACFEEASPGISRLIVPVPSARQIKALVGHCQHLFTCRLHLGIATLGMGCPVTGFPYRGKFEGQFERFGMCNYLCYKEDLPTTAEGLVHFFLKNIDSGNELADKIISLLPTVREAAQKNFCGMIPLG